MDGVLIIDKPAGLTSHDVVNRARRMLGERSIGHLGTLDPMATGVLVLVVGRLTRLAQFYLHSEKTYEGSICFGVATDTYDAEGVPMGKPVVPKFTRDELESAMDKYRGTILQSPPPFSAKKVNGVPAYKLARKHEEVQLKPVEVNVKTFEVLDLSRAELPVPSDPAVDPALSANEGVIAKFRAEVSSGTYIRSLAHDLGKDLGSGAHLQSLKRMRVAEFSLEQAVSLEHLAEAGDPEELKKLMVHPREILPLIPNVTASEEQIARVRHGNAVNLSDFGSSKLIKVFSGQSDLICIASRIAGTLFQPKVVLIGG